MLTDFGYILLFIIFGIILVCTVIFASSLLHKKKPNDEKLTTYESGEDPQGNANIRFNMKFYVVALVFVLFEVELLYLFPWSVVFGNAELIEQSNGMWGWFALAEMSVFILILVIGLAFAWRKGYLDWVKSEPKIPTINSPIPDDLYSQFNENGWKSESAKRTFNQ